MSAPESRSVATTILTVLAVLGGTALTGFVGLAVLLYIGLQGAHFG